MTLAEYKEWLNAEIAYATEQRDAGDCGQKHTDYYSGVAFALRKALIYLPVE